MDAAPPGAHALGLFFGPPDSASSLFLSSVNRTILAVGFILLTTSLLEASRWSRLRCGHRGQRFGWRCQITGEFGEIPCGWISKKIVSEVWQCLGVKGPHVMSGMRPRSESKPDCTWPAELLPTVDQVGGAQVRFSGPKFLKTSNCGSGSPGS